MPLISPSLSLHEIGPAPIEEVYRTMPHLFTNRPRRHNLTRSHEDLGGQFRWETINAILYKIGGAIFIVGSVFFFPRFERYVNIGAWIFFAGSLVYLVVTAHDFLEVRRYWKETNHHGTFQVLEQIAASSYVWGTILFTAGSLFFVSVIGWFRAGAWCFILGSLFFVVGASINVLQIVKAENIITLQLMNLTAITFVVGSVLFTVASVPYLWSIQNTTFQSTLHAYLAWQYLIGSILFFMGGVFNYWKAYTVIRNRLAVQNNNRDLVKHS